MSQASIRRDDLVWAAALTLPLLARLHAEGLDAALQRLLLLGAVAIVVHAWAWLFARTAQRPLGSGLPAFALGFVLLLPGPVGWGGALLAVSFGAVFGREIFGGRALLPPALIALVFAVYSFPDGGFEARQVLTLTPDPVFTLACLAGAALGLVLRGTLAWQVAAGALAGALLAGGLTAGGDGWAHLARGNFAAGVLFLAAAPESAASGRGAQWLHGLLVGVLAVVIRLADPEAPDGVVFAVLLGALFAPLIDRALGWRPRLDPA